MNKSDIDKKTRCTICNSVSHTDISDVLSPYTQKMFHDDPSNGVSKICDTCYRHGLEDHLEYDEQYILSEDDGIEEWDGDTWRG